MEKKRVLATCGNGMLSASHQRELGNLFDAVITEQCFLSQNWLIGLFGQHHIEGLVLGGFEHITRRVLETHPLQWIIFLGEQPETFIDMEACKEKNIPVFKTGGGARSVAQKTFGQIVNPDRIRNWAAKRGKSISGSDKPVSQMLFQFQKVAIIGAGLVGQTLLKKLEKLPWFGPGKTIYAGGRGEKEELRNKGFAYVKYLEEAFDADVVTLHLSYVPGATEGIITPDVLKNIRHDGLLINNACAELVDPFGLLKFLEIRHDITCIFDVFWKRGAEFEDLASRDILRQLIDLPNFFFTQHSAALHVPKWTQQEYWEKLQKIITENNLAN